MISGIELAKHLLLPPPSLIRVAAPGKMLCPFRPALDVLPFAEAVKQSLGAIPEIVGIFAYEATG